MMRIGFDVPFEPFGLLDEGKPSGMLIELIGMLLTRARIDHEFVSMALAETEGALFGGQVDALAFKGVTAERLQTMTFSDPLIVSGGAAFTRATPTDARPAAGLHAYAGMRLVTPRKGPLWAQVARDHPDITLVDGDSYEGTFAALIAGRADVAALNLHAGIAIANRLFPGRIHTPAAPYTPLPISFAIAKAGPVALVEAINRELAIARADRTWQRIHDRWVRPV